MMQGRLNLFQCAMLRWRELHPYCASHVITIGAPLDEARLRDVIAGVLEACGLTGLHLDADRLRYEFTGGPAAPALTFVDGKDAPLDVVSREIEATINRAFPRTGRFDPFRFFAVRVGDMFMLGLTYDHFIAGGDSIVVLVTDIADRYLAQSPLDVPLPELQRYPHTYNRLFWRHVGSLVRGLASLPRLMAGWRRAIRPHLYHPEDGHNGFACFAIDPARVAAFRATAKRWAITNNDLMLALVSRAIIPIASQRSHTGRRNQLGLASIVNVRAEFERPAHETFGQFLSSFRVVQPFAVGRPLEDLARAIAVQSRLAKQGRLYLVTLLAMGVAAFLWRFASPARRHRLYLKYHPVFAGLTPLNVDALRRRGPSRDGDYLRAASTGPMAPMVVAVTSAGAGQQVGITYRSTSLSRAQVDAVIESILRDLDTLG